MPELSEAMRGFTGLTAVTIVFLVAGGALIACNRTVERGARNAFLSCLVALACIAIADWFMFVTDGTTPELQVVHTVLMALTFAVAPVLPATIGNVIYPDRSANNIKLVAILLAIHAVFELGGILGGYVFWVDEGNVYHRGELYPLYMAVYTASSVYLVIQTIRAGRMYQSAQVAAVLGIIACMFTGVAIQVADSDVRMTWPAASMAVVLYFMFYSDMVLRTDALTSLLNRRSFEDTLEKPPLPCVAVVIDVDDFKHVNDDYGHAFGDECLMRTARMIRRAYSGAGLCYRTGGDEFAVIMTRRLAEADAISAELGSLVAESQRKDGRMPSLSIGYCAASKTCTDISEVFDAADQAMYQAKRDRKAKRESSNGL